MRFCEISSVFVSLNITFLSNDTKAQRSFSYTHESFNCHDSCHVHRMYRLFRSKLKPINSFGFFCTRYPSVSGARINR